MKTVSRPEVPGASRRASDSEPLFSSFKMSAMPQNGGISFPPRITTWDLQMGINKLDQLTAQPIFHAQIEEEGFGSKRLFCVPNGPVNKINLLLSELP